MAEVVVTPLTEFNWSIPVRFSSDKERDDFYAARSAEAAKWRDDHDLLYARMLGTLVSPVCGDGGKDG